MPARPRGRHSRIKAVAVGCAAVLGVFLLYVGLTRAPSDPANVNLLNMESFKEQLRKDLPLGTAKEDVAAYLERRKIDYEFYGPDSVLPSAGNAFYALLEDVGPPFITLYLEIRIRLDEQEKVRVVDLRLGW